MGGSGEKFFRVDARGEIRAATVTRPLVDHRIISGIVAVFSISSVEAVIRVLPSSVLCGQEGFPRKPMFTAAQTVAGAASPTTDRAAFSARIIYDLRPRGALQNLVAAQAARAAWCLRRCEETECRLGIVAAGRGLDPMEDAELAAREVAIGQIRKSAEESLGRSLEQLRMLKTETSAPLSVADQREVRREWKRAKVFVISEVTEILDRNGLIVEQKPLATAGHVVSITDGRSTRTASATSSPDFEPPTAA